MTQGIYEMSCAFSLSCIRERSLLTNKEAYDAMAHAVNPYGDGHACVRIADILEGKEYTPWEP